jgi:mitosis inhibitor protein kinase SWE1
MLASTVDYRHLHTGARDLGLSSPCNRASQSHNHLSTSPSYNRTPLSHHSTPQRLFDDTDYDPLMLYDSPMLTPSPLRRPPVQSTKCPAPPSSPIYRQPPHFFPSSTSQPLRTPVKRIHNAPYNPQPSPNNVVTGAKRKSTPMTTPFHRRLLTPLNTSSKQNSGFAFLAPLPAPRFNARSPHTKAETEVHLRNQTDTMTNLRICDLDDDSPDEFGDDSGYADDDQHFPALCLDPKKQQEVAEVVSPSGHVSKRRAKSRPLSSELLGYVNNGRGRTSPSPSRVSLIF